MKSVTRTLFFSLLFHSTFPCNIPFLSKCLYPSPQIVLPQNNSIVYQVVGFQWTESRWARAYKLLVNGPNITNQSASFEVESEFLNRTVQISNLGIHSAKVAAIGRWGQGKWSPVVQFAVLKKPKPKPKPKPQPGANEKPEPSPRPPPKPKNLWPHITEPRNDTHVFFEGYTFFKWIETHNAAIYKLEVKLLSCHSNDDNDKIGTVHKFETNEATLNVTTITVYGKYSLFVCVIDNHETEKCGHENFFYLDFLREFTFMPVSKKWMEAQTTRLNLTITGEPRPEPTPVLKKINQAPPSDKIQSIGGDGNCFFRAISHVLTNDEAHYALLRKLVCEELEKHPERNPAMAADGPADVYFKNTKMTDDKVWATHTEVWAMAHVLSTNIYCYGGSHLDFSAPWQKLPAEDVYDAANEAIYLVNPGNHYMPFYEWP